MPVSMSAAVDNNHLKCAWFRFSVVNWWPLESLSCSCIENAAISQAQRSKHKKVCSGNLIQGQEVGKVQPTTTGTMLYKHPGWRSSNVFFMAANVGILVV